MASKKKRLIVAIDPVALRDLASIWTYNAERYGTVQANRYDEFLLRNLNRIAEFQNPGRQVPGHENRRYATFQYRSKGHGHVAVFALIAETLVVYRIFHTAQDWMAKAYDIPPDDGHSDATIESEG